MVQVRVYLAAPEYTRININVDVRCSCGGNSTAIISALTAGEGWWCWLYVMFLTLMKVRGLYIYIFSYVNP